MKVLAIYEWDNANTVYEAAPVTDGNLPAVLTEIEADLLIDTDGIVLPAMNAAGDNQVPRLVQNRRKVTYFGMTRTIATGQSLMMEVLPNPSKLSGQEYRDFMAFEGQVAGAHVGRKLLVDRMTGTPLGGLQFIYRGAENI